MKKYFMILGAVLLVGFSFLPNQTAVAQGCVVCGVGLNDAAIHSDLGGCYCIGYGSDCKFEADSTSQCVQDT